MFSSISSIPVVFCLLDPLPVDVRSTHVIILILSHDNIEGMSPLGVAENKQIILSEDTSTKSDLPISLSPRGCLRKKVKAHCLSLFFLSLSIKNILQEILKYVKPMHTCGACVIVQMCVC
ncbi:hypothetical protein ILYODFUR_012976 [Ilyodon furcidens]|uniref:Uncharacterized protein n=1 Tax=Ilyodon furcidens TaxID=33524 RepID=A0ABV0V672_9TELE